VTVEGIRLAAQIQTKIGQYFSVVEYPVNIQDNTLSITLGGGGKGRTLLNFLIINSDPNLPQTMQTLAQSFGTNLLATVKNPGTVMKVDPGELAKEERIRRYVLAKEEKIRRYVLAKEERIRRYVLAKIQSQIEKIEQMLVNSADNPTKVVDLNRKKEQLLAKLDKIQENQSIN
jgi:hypothetical protein